MVIIYRRHTKKKPTCCFLCIICSFDVIAKHFLYLLFDTFETDEFATPCSTPDELDTMTLEGIKEDMERKSSHPELQPQFSEASLHDRIYDKYVKCCFISRIVKHVNYLH